MSNIGAIMSNRDILPGKEEIMERNLTNKCTCNHGWN